MSQRPALAKSELEVARIVWNLGKATVRQVLDALPEDRRLDFKTVQTYLRRLQAKGYVHCRRQGRTNVYSSRVRPGQVIRQVVDDMVNRLFDGQPFPLVQHLLESPGLSDEQVERLQETLDQLKARKNEPHSP